jgi:cytochrome P450
MAHTGAYQQILDYASRADPYPLFAELRKTPVAAQDDGSYVVSTYREIVALLHDPRVSSDRRNLLGTSAVALAEAEVPEDLPRSFIVRDPPDHDRLRALTMRHFGPPHTPGKIDGMRPELIAIITGLIDAIAAGQQADIVDDVAYPFPVTVICRLLGVPREDEQRFRTWADVLVESAGPGSGDLVERQRKRVDALTALGRYLGGLIDARRADPGDDLLSGLLTHGGPGEGMSRADMVSNASLLLVAGHETTVNLITNGMLALLRRPELLDRVRHEPELVIPLVEELLRFEPPVQFALVRAALADIEIAGTTIPKGAPIVLALAAGSRDPDRVRDPDRFDPDRTENEHLGFGGGVHYCFGAPLARLETQLALTELARRLVNPRLVADPPPYRPSSTLRGPRHLRIEFDGVLR